MKHLAATALASMLVLLPGGAAGLGLGNIEVESNLNEPLRAKIALRSVQKGDTEALQIRLGTPEQFKRAGIARPFLLAKLNFEVVEDGPARAHIRVTTKDPVAEPILNFLLELNWARGRVVREYAVFLDPKVYGAAISSTTRQSVPTIERPSEADTVGRSAPRRVKAAPESDASPSPEPVRIEPATSPEPIRARQDVPDSSSAPGSSQTQTVTAPVPEAAMAPAREPAPLSPPAPASAPTEDPAPMAADDPTPRRAGGTMAAPAEDQAPASARDPAPFDMSELSTVLSQDSGPEEVVPFSAEPVSKPRKLTTLAGTVTGEIYGPTSEADTLWSIAIRARPDESISVNRMMLAILEANPDAFELENVNTLKVGYVLQIPARERIGPDDVQTALAEVTRHHAAWEEYRQTVASTVLPAPQGSMAATGETSPDNVLDTAVSDSETSPSAVGTPVGTSESTDATAQRDSEATLRLLAAGSSTDQVGAVPGDQSEVRALRNELNLALEDADSQRREREELGSRLAEAEQLIADLQRLVELKDDDIAALQDRLATQSQVEAQTTPEASPGVNSAASPPFVPATSNMEPEPTGQTAPSETPDPLTQSESPADPDQAALTQTADADSTATTPPVATTEGPPAPAKPAKPTAARRMPPPPEPSLMDKLRDMLPVDPVVAAAGLGGIVLALIGGVALVRSSKKRSGAAPEGIPAVAISEEEVLPEELDLGAGPESIIIEELDEPVSAEFGTPVEAHLAGSGTLDEDLGETTKLAQNEEEDPLAEVNVYLAYERYDQAEELVRSAIAQHPTRHEYRLRLLEVFYAAKSVAAFESTARELQEAVGADSPLMEKATTWWADLSPERELFADATSDASAQGLDEDVFDVDTGGAGAVDTVDIGDGVDTQATGVDFDLSFDTETADQTASDQSASVDFDLGLELAEERSDEAAAEGSLDFDLGNMDEVAEETTGDPSEASSLDLDLSGLNASDEAPAKNDTEATGLDFDLGTLDADVSQSTDESPVAAIERVAEATGTGLDFDLGGLDETTPAAGGSVTEMSKDTALEFDLAAGSTGEESTDGTGTGTVDGAGLNVEAESASDGLESFDLNLEIPAAAEDDATAQVAEAADGSFDFDIGSELPIAVELEEPSADASRSAEEADLDFSLDLDPSVSVEDVSSEFEEAAKSVDLELSMDLGESIDLEGATSLGSGDKATGLDLGLLAEEADDSALAGPVDAAGAAADEALESDSELTGGASVDDPAFGIDTQFRGVFSNSNQDVPSEQSAASDTGLDLDLDAGDGSGLGVSDDMSLDLELESTLMQAEANSGDGDESLDLAVDAGAAAEADAGQDAEAMPESEFESTQYMLRDVSAPEAPDGEGTGDLGRTLLATPGLAGDVDEIQTKLDLAQAYIDMEDFEGARGILGEVLAEGSPAQQEQAKGLLSKLA